MNEAPDELVIDTGPLSHLAEAGFLSVLRDVAGTRQVVIPDAVEAECREGSGSHPHLNQVLDAEWISVRTLDTAEEVEAFVAFAARLVVGQRNVGEAAVLAYAKAHSATAVVDDRAGRRAGREAGVTIRPLLSLLAEAIRGRLLTIQEVSDLADELIATDYRLPFGRGDFARWATEQGLEVGHDASNPDSRRSGDPG